MKLVCPVPGLLRAISSSCTPFFLLLFFFSQRSKTKIISFSSTGHRFYNSNNLYEVHFSKHNPSERHQIQQINHKISLIQVNIFITLIHIFSSICTKHCILCLFGANLSLFIHARKLPSSSCNVCPS